MNLLNQTFVNSHLKGVPGLGSFTTGSFSCRNLESLCWEAYRALDTKILGLRTFNELLTDLLEGSDLSASEGDADLDSFLCFC